MHVAYGLRNLDHSADPVFVVVGVFDGLHLGHIYLLHRLVVEAAARDARPVVVTFDHHPDEIITGTAPPLLCDPAERLARLEAAGVETTVVVHFDRQLRETTYDAFVAMIAARAPISGFLMTPDAAFGYQRAGTPEALAELGRASGFDVVVVPPLELDGRPVRSSDVRAAIASGDLVTAAGLLGRPHAVVGEAASTVDGVEVAFGLPVALPPDGEYAVELGMDGSGARAEATVRSGRVCLPAGSAVGAVRVAFLVARRD
jgi:riboflavin kinase / FMN adenylyltransferase